jgi:hypothetical protein
MGGGFGRATSASEEKPAEEQQQDGDRDED